MVVITLSYNFIGVSYEQKDLIETIESFENYREFVIKKEIFGIKHECMINSRTACYSRINKWLTENNITLSSLFDSRAFFISKHMLEDLIKYMESDLKDDDSTLSLKQLKCLKHLKDNCKYVFISSSFIA